MFLSAMSEHWIVLLFKLGFLQLSATGSSNRLQSNVKHGQSSRISKTKLSSFWYLNLHAQLGWQGQLDESSVNWSLQIVKHVISPAHPTMQRSSFKWAISRHYINGHIICIRKLWLLINLDSIWIWLGMFAWFGQ